MGKSLRACLDEAEIVINKTTGKRILRVTIPLPEGKVTLFNSASPEQLKSAFVDVFRDFISDLGKSNQL